MLAKMESTYSYNQTLPPTSSEPQIASNLPIYLGAFLLIGSTSVFINFFSKISSKLPTINPAKSRWSDQDAKKLYNFNARQLIADGFRKVRACVAKQSSLALASNMILIKYL